MRIYEVIVCNEHIPNFIIITSDKKAARQWINTHKPQLSEGEYRITVKFTDMDIHYDKSMLRKGGEVL